MGRPFVLLRANPQAGDRTAATLHTISTFQRQIVDSVVTITEALKAQ
jgi:hypothetical protein